MKFRKRKKRDARIFTSALNDILFILLLFFLIVATLANPNVIKVNNPEASTENRVKQTVIVTIDSLQNFYVGSESILADSLSEEIFLQLHDASDDDRTVVINADKRADAESIVEVMKAARNANARTVFAVESP